MTTSDNTPIKKEEGSHANPVDKKSVKKKPFWKRHFLSLFLLALLVISVAWGYFANRSTVSQYEKQITTLTQEHESQLKELKVKHIAQLSNTLALAVRSEMIAENMSQVNQYFLQTLKTFEVEKVLLANHKSGKVILSTNKKDEETVFGNKALVNAKESMTKVFNKNTYAATPIMGLNSQLGVLIIQVD
jgi:Ca2+/Na+ antiporter